jgi:oligopeptide/dipeptide ABC transporter ATP-binding protein
MNEAVKNCLLDIDGLKTHFFLPEGLVKAVDGVSFGIPEGKCIGILGESGCGKSVTAMSVMRLIPDPPGKIVAGSILFEETDLLKIPLPQMRKIRGNRISVIFQEPMSALNPVYTIGEQISDIYRTHRGASKKDGLDKAVDMLHLVGIPSPEKRAGEYPHQLSGGMRQRAMIAMAMVCQPKLLVADEPTTALDVTIQAQILDLMLELQEEMKMAIMLITHDLGVISEMADDVVVMYAGQVVEHASIDDIFSNPLHPYTIGLMKSLPRLGDKFLHGEKPLSEMKGMVPSLSNLPPGCLFALRCSHAMDRCQKLKPPLFEIDNRHETRCWLMDKKE